MKICKICSIDKPLEDFYKSITHSHGVMYCCKSCFNRICQNRWIKRKLDALIYKGNKCIDCNLQCNSTNYPIFEFHHIDPSTKLYDWGKLRLKSWSSIIKELDKTEILCSNCHKLRHYHLKYD